MERDRAGRDGTNTTQHWSVPVEQDQTTALYEPPAGPSAGCLFVLAHGAGTDMSHASMDALAATFRTRGFDVVRFDFLYRALGKGPPDRMPRLMACWSAVVESARSRFQPQRLLIGGHSMGGRAASMLAAEGAAADGLVLLGYPLHPAGRPEKLRAAHLPAITIPTICLNETRDALCTPSIMKTTVAPLAPNWTQHWLDGADHAYKVLKRSGRTTEDVLDELGATVAAWWRRIRG